jgi:hypothetical protein
MTLNIPSITDVQRAARDSKIQEQIKAWQKSTEATKVEIAKMEAKFAEQQRIEELQKSTDVTKAKTAKGNSIFKNSRQKPGKLFNSASAGMDKAAISTGGFLQKIGPKVAKNGWKILGIGAAGLGLGVLALAAGFGAYKLTEYLVKKHDEKKDEEIAENIAKYGVNADRDYNDYGVDEVEDDGIKIDDDDYNDFFNKPYDETSYLTPEELGLVEDEEPVQEAKPAQEPAKAVIQENPASETAAKAGNAVAKSTTKPMNLQELQDLLANLQKSMQPQTPEAQKAFSLIIRSGRTIPAECLVKKGDNIWKMVKQVYPECKSDAQILAKVNEIIQKNNLHTEKNKFGNLIFPKQKLQLSPQTC